jgi:hypothetical protein
MALYAISIMASATEYYVKVGGDNSADGKSDETAWATISKVNSTNFIAGDIIHFNCGDTWREMLTVTASGTSSAYVKYTKYGTGDNPRILGSNVTTWSNYGNNVWVSDDTFTNPRSVGLEGAEVYFENNDGSVSWGGYKSGVSSLTAEYNWTYSSSKIYIYSTSDPDSKYNSVEIPQRAFIFDLNYKNYINIDAIDLLYCGYAAVQFDAEDGAWTAQTGLIIENLEIAYVSTKGSEAGYGTQAAWSNMTVRGCDVHDCGRRALSFHVYGGGFTVDNVLIENNYFHHGLHTTGPDLQPYPSSSFNNWIIRNNIFDDSNTYSVSDANFILMQNPGNSKPFDEFYIYNNIFIHPKLFGILMEGTGGKTYIWNNVFIGPCLSGQCSLEIQVMNGAQCHVDVRNNIFYSDGSRELEIENGQSASNVTLSNNVFYKAASNMGTGTNSITSNPLFVSVAQKDFHLLSSSPAIGAGIDVGLSADFEGNAYSNPPNIGCYSTYIISSADSMDLLEDGSDPDTGVIDIYPNPNNGHFTIVIQSGLPDHNNRIRIVNSVGKLICDGIIDGPESYREFNLTGKIGPGIYFVTLTNDKNVFFTKKFVKR